MKKKLIIGLTIILFIASIIILNEFVLFSLKSNNVGSAPSCIFPALYSSQENSYGLVENSDLILTGTVKESKWVTTDKIINTHSTIIIDEILFGDYNNKEIMVSSSGGCNIRLNYCVQTSISQHPKLGDKYLLFLSEKDNNIYGGFSNCGGIYQIENDEIDCSIRELNGCENNKISLENLKIQIY
jgi:hypothetical protein